MLRNCRELSTQTIRSACFAALNAFCVNASLSLKPGVSTNTTPSGVKISGLPMRISSASLLASTRRPAAVIEVRLRNTSKSSSIVDHCPCRRAEAMGVMTQWPLPISAKFVPLMVSPVQEVKPPTYARNETFSYRPFAGKRDRYFLIPA